ncbi:MAG: endolytic transglycosylase MltG [Pseudomonadota bacterium]
MSDAGDPAPGRARIGVFGMFLRLFIIAAFLVGAAALGGAYYAQQQYMAAGPSTADGEARNVVVPAGASVRRMADTLAEAGAIEDPFRFRLAARVLDVETDLKAGEYAVPSGASLKEILEILREGKAVLYPITIPEGLTSAMIMRRLEASEVLTGDLPEVTPAEGVLLPDTYLVPRGETREAMVSRMIRAKQEVVEELWASRQPGLPIDTPEDAVILASIVEKETGMAEERPRVAAVFVNRLRRPMRLESDPTIIYGISQGEPLGRGLRRSEIDRKTPYNTYQIDGLPPTPICNPGRDAIAAVLDPPQTNDLFFVADGTGGHAFATTYAEHRRNVANWRKIEAARRQ